MKLAVGADGKTPTAGAVLADLQRRGHVVVVFGPLAGEKMLWPTVARRVSRFDKTIRHFGCVRIAIW